MSSVIAPAAPSTQGSVSLAGLGQLLPRLADTFGNRTALVTDTRTLTFHELNDASDRVAAGLVARGIQPGDRISLLSQNRWEWIVAYHASLKVGAVVNPLNVMLTGEEIAYIMNDSEVKAIFASQDRLDAVGGSLGAVPTLALQVSFDAASDSVVGFADLLETSAEDFTAVTPDPDSLACIAYTSGTTGHPKGAMQSHRSLVLNCAYTATMHGRTEDEVVVTALPAPHVYGNVVLNGTFMVGGSVVLMTRFDPGLALELIEKHRATLFEGVPAMYAMLLAHPDVHTRDLTSLKRSTVGGQTIAASVEQAWEKITGAPIIELWGMTELSGLGTTHAIHAPNVHGSIGVSLPGVEVRIADPDNPKAEAPAETAGELLVRGPLVMMGYVNNPQATAETIDEDGWLHTGDVATKNAAGHIFIVDRLKDMILTSGYNVYPAEIERVLIGHDDVALVAVGRADDEVKGEVAHAYVVLHANRQGDAAALLDYAREHLAAYKVPRAVHFVESLPTTSSGKLMRRSLKPPTA